MANGADILIIDDDKDLVNTVRIILKSRHYEVRTAHNGDDGHAEIEKKIPDLIILDVMMSTDTDGFDLAYKLKNSPDYRDIPILMLSSFPQKMAEQGPESFQHILGESWPVTEFHEKPIDPDDLLDAVEDILREEGQI